MTNVNSPGNQTKQYAEKRTVPRYNLIASVELIEPVSSVRIAGRISELSRKGCYVDALNNLPPQTVIQIRISRDKGTFTSQGRVVYVQEAMGMGIAFVNPAADQLKLLDAWLAEIAS